VQLITQVHGAPNNTDDSTLLAHALADLNARTGGETLFTDGEYGSSENDSLLVKHQVTLVQTASWGRAQSLARLHLEDVQVQRNAANDPVQRTCPKGKTGWEQASLSGDSWIAVCGAVCATCDVQPRSLGAKQKRLGTWALPCKREDLHRAERRRRLRQHQGERRSLRAAVESPLRSIKYGFASGNAPVRGLFRITCMVVGAAAVVNIRRLHRFWQAKMRPKQREASKKGGRKNTSEGKSNRKMRLFFLCFEEFGRSHSYRWPSNPFNAQSSVGNVRLFAVDSVF